MSAPLFLLLSGCGPQVWCDRFNLACDPVDDLVHQAPEDKDGDVWPDDEDCAPEDAGVHPGATEVCDGVDNDCDGAVDEGTPGIQTWYLDNDGDGYGVDDVSQTSCEPMGSWALVGGDCDDLDAAVHPGQPEVCDNGLDDDCSGDAAACGLAGTITAGDADLTLVSVSGPGTGRPSLSLVAASGSAAPFVAIGDPDAGPPPGAGSLAVIAADRRTLGGTVDLLLPAPSVRSGAAGAALGSAVVGAVDLVGNDRPDLAIGAPGYTGDDAEEGLVVVVDPRASVAEDLDDAWVRVTGGRSGARLGTALATVRRVDEDDTVALLAGAPGLGAGGAAVLLLAPLDGDLEAGDAWLRVDGTVEGGALGDGLASGDLDGDGLGDIVLAAPDAEGGTVYLGFAPFDAARLTVEELDVRVDAEAAGDRAGAALEVGADLDGDGRADLVVGAPGADADRGRVYVLTGGATLHRHSGRLSLESADVRLDGSDEGGRAGSALATGADASNDGHPDLLIGAPGTLDPDLGADGSGAAWLVHGGDLGSHPLDPALDVRILATEDIQELGCALLILPDIDRNGPAELLVGARGPTLLVFRPDGA